MVNEEVIQKWNAQLIGGKKLILLDHLLLFDCLVESDEDAIVFTQSFVLVGPEQNDRRMMLKRLDLSFSDFTYPGDHYIADSVLRWLADSDTQHATTQGQLVTKQNDLWKPSWHTKSTYMSEGASYVPLLN